MPRLDTICVFCGSSRGRIPAYAEAAREMGRAIAARGLALVYGGGAVGTMGVLASSAMEAGGRVTGIIPDRLNRMVNHLELTELLVVEDMHRRKAAMQERSDAFIAMPGGIGTFEELFEVWTWRCLGYHRKPVGILNTSGFFDGLLSFVDHAGAEGFITPSMRKGILVASEPAEMLDLLARAAETA